MSENNASARVFYILVQFFAVSGKTTMSNNQTKVLWEREHTTVNFPFSIWNRKPSLRIQQFVQTRKPKSTA